MGKLFQQQGAGGADSAAGHEGRLKPPHWILTILVGAAAAAAAWEIIRSTNPV